MHTLTRQLRLAAASPASLQRLLAPATLKHAQGHRHFMLSGIVAAAAAADGTSPGIQDRLKADMKEAMKAKNQARLDAIRFLQAALKQREIELRESSQTLSEAEAIKVIQKMAKQRQDSIDSYRQGGREDLVEKEEQELTLLRGYLPTMLSPAELQVLVDAAVAELGATSVKQMGAVIKAVQAKSEGRAESKAISDLVKAKLAAGK